MHTAVPAIKLDRPAATTTLTGSPLFATLLEDLVHGPQNQNCAKFLALLIIAGQECNAATWETEVALRPVLHQMIDICQRFCDVITAGTVDDWWRPQGFWNGKVDTAYLLKEIGAFTTLCASNGSLDYLKVRTQPNNELIFSEIVQS